MNNSLFLRELTLFQFKSYLDCKLKFSQPTICFLGNNGSGKTNLLDAIHYLCFCKSYFNSIDSQNIKSGEEQAGISGSFLKNDNTDEVSCGLRKNQRKVFKKNHKEYDKLADHIGHFPAVIITPYDIELILEGSEVRRKFIDATLSQLSKTYLDHLMNYNQALLQRNNVLKAFAQRENYSSEVLEPWDHLLHQHGTIIREERLKFIKRFNPLFESVYRVISNGNEVPSIKYVSDLDEVSMADLLLKYSDKDRYLERTTRGIHRDELEFELDALPLKKYGSQGQQKSFLIALKLAQFSLLQQDRGITPILLLDDMFDKVDETRVANMLRWMGEHSPGQVFISDTHIDRIPQLLLQHNMPHEAFHVQRSVVSEISPIEI